MTFTLRNWIHPAEITLVLLVGFLCFDDPGWAGQIDSATYFLLDEGMSEGEVLIRAGAPDKEIYFDSEAQRTAQSIKQLLYIPEPGEPDPNLTIINIQRGRVISIERIKLFSSPSKRTGGQMDFETYSRLAMGMSEGEVLVRAGLPDKEALIGSGREAANESIKQLLYIPGPGEHDPHLTIVTIMKGKVIGLERTKIISR